MKFLKPSCQECKVNCGQLMATLDTTNRNYSLKEVAG